MRFEVGVERFAIQPRDGQRFGREPGRTTSDPQLAGNTRRLVTVSQSLPLQFQVGVVESDQFVGHHLELIGSPDQVPTLDDQSRLVLPVFSGNLQGDVRQRHVTTVRAAQRPVLQVAMCQDTHTHLGPFGNRLGEPHSQTLATVGAGQPLPGRRLAGHPHTGDVPAIGNRKHHLEQRRKPALDPCVGDQVEPVVGDLQQSGQCRLQFLAFCLGGKRQREVLPPGVKPHRTAAGGDLFKNLLEHHDIGNTTHSGRLPRLQPHSGRRMDQQLADVRGDSREAQARDLPELTDGRRHHTTETHST